MPAASIALFPSMCEDWLAKHPEFPQAPGETAVMILKNSSYQDLVKLVDMMERQQ